MASPVVLVGSNAPPATEATTGVPHTPTTIGVPMTLIASGGKPVVLIDEDFAAWSGALLMEDGNYLLLENGDYLLLE